MILGFCGPQSQGVNHVVTESWHWSIIGHGKDDLRVYPASLSICILLHFSVKINGQHVLGTSKHTRLLTINANKLTISPKDSQNAANHLVLRIAIRL